MGTMIRLALLVGMFSFAHPASGQELTGPHGEAGMAAMEEGRFAAAESHFAAGYEAADAESRGMFAFFRGFAVFRQGDQLARSNSEGRVEEAREALSHFERALPMVLDSGHRDEEVLARALRQYIDNQHAIIRAGERDPR
jgi:hypothetical protein